MQRFRTLADAIALAEYAHRNQTDKAGLPYIDHPKRVLAKVQAQGAMPFVQIAAILHDVTEDTAFTVQMIGDLGFPSSVTKLITLLDRHTYNSFEDPSTAYYRGIKQDQYAVMIKRADIEDNLSPWRLAYLLDDEQTRLKNKYARALEIIG